MNIFDVLLLSNNCNYEIQTMSLTTDITKKKILFKKFFNVFKIELLLSYVGENEKAEDTIP